MRILLALLLFFISSSGFASKTEVKFKLLAEQQIPSDQKFKDTRVGGLSGLVWDEPEKMFWAISDDRGTQGEPRLYGFSLGAGSKPQLKLEKVIFLKDPKKKFRVFDFEGISLLPWGNFLLSSEGDMNKKPRVQPALFEFQKIGSEKKKSGDLIRSFEVPPDYLAEEVGQQTKGVRNNFSFEGLASDGKVFLVASELPLVQDQKNEARILEMTQPEAWVLKPGREWRYPLGGMEASLSLAGISEIIHDQGSNWWVLERSGELSLKGLGFSAQIYQIEIPATGKTVKKNNILDLDSFKKANFEAMSWGPHLPNGKRLFVVMSDNNFDAKSATQILFFEVEP